MENAINSHVDNTAAEKVFAEDTSVNASTKRNLLMYLAISAISFSFFILTARAGVSVLVFIGIQFICMWLWSPRRKPLLMFIPLFIFGINAFISANFMWRVPNFFAAILIYSVMALWMTGQISFRNSLLEFALKPLMNLVTPFVHVKAPFSWGMAGRRTHLPIMKRVLIGVAISIPCLMFLIIMLASADAIFAQSLSQFMMWMEGVVNLITVLRLITGVIAGFYLFGMLYYINRKERKNIEFVPMNAVRGDVLIINIVLGSALAIYTVFVAIQFRYLFASPNNLPFGLNFVTYARRGFFELMLLAGINIFAILLTVWLTRVQDGRGARLVKAFCFYLCAVTCVLLASSFYRMWLYGSDDGLTRMRFMVFAFLIFKAVGLVATFVYIAKPLFNIIAVYCIIALCFYMFLNIVPMDSIVARSQIDRYLATGRGGVHYVLSLSPDTAPQVERLLTGTDENTRRLVQNHFSHTHFESTNWRQWNLSVNRFNRIRKAYW